MNCDDLIHDDLMQIEESICPFHDDLKEIEESICPFCDELLVEGDKEVETCCDEPDIGEINGQNVCLKCGRVGGYVYASEYIDFYENMYKFRKKSVYHQKYHIMNVLDDICARFKIHISHKDRAEIIKMFKKIKGVMLADKRKRSIKFNFIIRKLLELSQSPHYKYFNIPRSLKTLNQYNKIWKDICENVDLKYIESKPTKNGKKKLRKNTT